MLPPAASSNRNRATTHSPATAFTQALSSAGTFGSIDNNTPVPVVTTTAVPTASSLRGNPSRLDSDTFGKVAAAPLVSQIALAPRQVVTTVVTTTTTRTTDFPPLHLPPAPQRSRFDRETYPLAKTPTPAALKKFSFDLHGIPTSISELNVEGEQQGSTPKKTTLHGNRHHRIISRPASPGPTPTHTYPPSAQVAESPLSHIPRKRAISPEQSSSMTASTVMHERNLSFSSLTASLQGARAPKRRGSIGASSSSAASFAARSATNEIQNITSAKPHLAGGPISIPLTPYPEANPVHIPGAGPNPESGMNDISAVNLPSPTASPTQTAFSNEIFDDLPLATINRMVGQAQQDQPLGVSTVAERWPSSMEISPEFAALPALGDIPHILTTFDTLPTPLKSYLLLQILRRCPFSTLQFVSSLILPSLKRDYIGLLPVELGYQVLQYLDLRSLGRCAAVSKKWKHVVDGDGAEVAVWKKRLMCEGWYDESEVREEVTPVHSVARRRRNTDAMEDSGDEEPLHLMQPRPINGKQARNDWPNDWAEYGSLLHESRRPTESFSEGLEVPPNLYKNLYRRHHLIRQNWFHGRYKHISFPGHAFNVVTCLQFDADKIVSGSDDQTIHIYDTRTGELKKRLEGHEGGVWALQYWNDVLVSGSTDRTVRVWDMEAGKCTHLFEGHTSTVRCLIIIIPHKNHETGRMEPDVPLVVTGSRDATLRVWRLPHPKRDDPWTPASGASSPVTDSATANPFFRHVLSGHSNSVRAIAGYGNTLVSGSYDSTVRIWNLGTGAVKFTCRGHREKVYSVGYSHELKRAVSGSMDASVKIWCTQTGTQLFNLEGHTSLVGLLELSPQYLVSAAADATLRVWSPTTGQCLANLTGHTAAITCFHHDPRLNRIVSGSDGGVKVWELSSTGYGSGQPPPGAPFGPSLAYTQGPNGPQPVHGRFIRDLIKDVQGVWRVRMDEQRLVCAVQRDGGRTWFEVLDFTEGLEAGVKVEGPGDRSAPDIETDDPHYATGDSDEEEAEEEDDDEGDDDDDDDEDGGATGAEQSENAPGSETDPMLVESFATAVSSSSAAQSHESGSPRDLEMWEQRTNNYP